ncbi:MAG: hypothetical protein FJ144_16140 [Deltaproteobacteria bacterium]|nr:hypothetical protein [Deltaproteobacteria bacterium]
MMILVFRLTCCFVAPAHAEWTSEEKAGFRGRCMLGMVALNLEDAPEICRCVADLLAEGSPSFVEYAERYGKATKEEVEVDATPFGRALKSCHRAQRDPTKAGAIRIKLRVECEHEQARAYLDAALRQEFAKIDDIRLVPDRELAALYLLATKTTGDTAHPDGYAIAIVHSSRYLATVAGEDFSKTAPTKEQAALFGLIAGSEEVRHMNVVHLTELTKFRSGEVAAIIVGDFDQKEIQPMKLGLEIGAPPRQ